MKSENNLLNQIKRMKNRVRLLMIERYALYGLSIGLIASSIIVLLSPKIDLLLDYRLWFAVILFGAIIGVVFGFIKRINDIDLAIAADIRTGMKERISTAVSFLSEPNHNDMESAVIQDAENHIRNLSPNTAFAHKFNKNHVIAAGSALIFTLSLFLPQYLANYSKTRKQEIAVMKSEGQKLVNVSKDLKEKNISKEEEIKKLAGRIEQLGRKMATGRMDKKQAMLKTRRLTEQVKQAQDRLAVKNSSSKSMSQANAEMNKAGREIAKQAAEEIAKRENIPSSEALKKVATDKRLAELSKKTSALTSAERKELAQAIKKYSNPNSKLSIPQELGAAITKLAENGDFKEAAKIMQDLAKKMNLGDMPQMDKEMLKQQVDKLAEALKNTDLNKLAKQMKENAEQLAKMSPEELEKLAEQIKQARETAQALKKAAST